MRGPGTSLLLAAALFAGGGSWLNAPSGFSSAALRGKLVLLDFWTYSRVDCVHPLPELARLQAEHPAELAVVGVHAPEAGARLPPGRLRQAVIRDEVSFPILDDSERKAWTAYGVTACPAFVLADPEGREAARFEGPGRIEELSRKIGELAEGYRAKGLLTGAPLDLPLERDARAPTPLSFPGKVTVDGAGKRIFISDTGHDRIVVADFSGKVRGIIGSGGAGVADGPFETAALDRPQGTALVGEDLYIADEGNDRVRQADLKHGRVRTMRQTFQMSSPWDLAFASDRLFIAAAGFHNLMMLNTHSGVLSHYAGNGREGSSDGTLTAASLAQPSGLAFGGGRLFVADSQAGSVRSIALSDPEVRTLASGLGRPLGLAYAGGALYVTDADEGTVRRLDPASGKLETVAGGFSEPGGLAPFQGGLLVADTGNNRLVRLSLDGKTRSELVLKGLQAPPQAPPTFPMPAPKTVVLPEAAVRSGKTARLLLDLSLPKGYRLHPLAPLFYGVAQTSGPVKFDPRTRKGLLRGAKTPIAIEFTAGEGKSEALVNLAFYYCREDGTGLCRAKSVAYDQPIAASAKQRVSKIVIPVAAD